MIFLYYFAVWPMSAIGGIWPACTFPARFLDPRECCFFPAATTEPEATMSLSELFGGVDSDDSEDDTPKLAFTNTGEVRTLCWRPFPLSWLMCVCPCVCVCVGNSVSSLRRKAGLRQV